jgi:galactonate dehydratase
MQAPASGDTIGDIRAFRAREQESGRNYTIVKVSTASGLTGYGECAAVAPEQVVRAREAMRGKPATAYDAARIALQSLPEMEAAVTTALIDIAGRRANAPAYQVLGGPTRNKARVLATLRGASDEELIASLKQAKTEGHLAFSVPAPPREWANHGKAYAEAARKRMNALRDAAGDGVDFVLDGGGALAPGDAQTLAAEFERFRLLWLDEPCDCGNLKAAAKVSAESVTPVGFGRFAKSASSFQDLLREDAIDILRPDLGRHSIAAIRRMATLAETYYIAVAPYHAGGPLATAAGLHLAASLPNFFIQQMPAVSAADRKLRTEITGVNVEAVSKGYCALPSGPGLGVKVNEASLERMSA